MTLREKVAEAMGDAIHHYFIPNDGHEDEAVKLWLSWELAVTEAAIATVFDALLSDTAVEAGAAEYWSPAIDRNGDHLEWEDELDITKEHCRLTARDVLKAAQAALTADDAQTGEPQ